MAYFSLCVLSGGTGWTLAIISLPLVAFNISRYVAKKEHKLYFITRRDYAHVFSQMRWQCIGKSCYYGVIFVAAVIMLIMKILQLARAI